MSLFSCQRLILVFAETKHPDTGEGGDNDPIDVLQLNDKPCTIGQIYKVRVLGTLAMVDGGETDWKLIVIDVSDPLAGEVRHDGSYHEQKQAAYSRACRLTPWLTWSG